MNKVHTIADTIPRSRAVRSVLGSLFCFLCSTTWSSAAPSPLDERTLPLAEITDKPSLFSSDVGASGQFTWWFPSGADEYVLPLSGGVLVEASRSDLMGWLRQGSPWGLTELPALGVRYGDRQLVVIIPWPHYAELIVEDRLGIRFSLPTGRHEAAPCEIVAVQRGTDLLEVARAFREWRASAVTTGGIPRPRPLADKVAANGRVARLLGAPHFYLWGPALFCRHDVPTDRWVAFARVLVDAPSESIGDRIARLFTDDQRAALHELAGAEWPMRHLTVNVAAALESVLTDRRLLGLHAEVAPEEVVRRNKQALGDGFAGFVNRPDSWGDGLSNSLLEALHEGGIRRALLLLCDLYGQSLRPEVATRADQLGYLLGPYDSYHSVHSPNAGPDSTWETAQFDLAAYDRGRVIDSDGTGHRGFRGRGYHFAPQMAWPYVQERVGGILERTAYATWFIDCDAANEYFDDYSPEHAATRVDDVRWRRQRLTWLESEHRLVVGSEGGSALFADVIHFGHGIHTPYIGHLDPAFRDPQSPHYLGRYWPPDGPEIFFKPVPLSPSLAGPYFDPTVRIPLYQAALGDEVIVTHHWGYGSLKFSDIATGRELLEVLYGVPPLYHLNRATWPERRERILRHLAFWGPIHQAIATAPLSRFAWLSDDRLVQRTTFQSKEGDVTVTVNFGDTSQAGYPPQSATVSGPIGTEERVYLP